SVQSNIVRFEVEMDAGDFASDCYSRGLYMLPSDQHGMRAVLHRDLSEEDVDAALQIMKQVVSGSSNP
ncbi:MAG: hypothetical protein CME03_00105, partial [Gemmatimonadaceae bacterium]|nr:hypothetical protein [Gemmatimonadaceae bacterium]